MSRTGLRSSSDGVKLSEDIAGNKMFCPSKTRNYSRQNILKKSKSPILNYEGGESCIHSTFKTCNNTKVNDTSISIICSLPLIRITPIINKLYKKKTSTETSLVVEPAETVETNRPLNETIITDCNSANSKTLSKILCLYCDKKFTSNKMLLKHVEKFHTNQKCRRSSVRNLHIWKKNCPLPISPTISTMSEDFPGCIFCVKTKPAQIAGSEKDLKLLFLHLIECHGDKYFGCKLCVLRFQNLNKLTRHMQTVHRNKAFVIDDNSKSKEDAYLPFENLSTMNKSRAPNTNTPYKTSYVNASQNPVSINSSTIIKSDESMLSHLNLLRNRLPNNRKGLRLRRDSVLQNLFHKPDNNISCKLRSKVSKNLSFLIGDNESVFRLPTRNEVNSCTIDEHFYNEVNSNVRDNLTWHLDGKLDFDNVFVSSKDGNLPSPSLGSLRNSDCMTEIHGPTNLTTSTTFPTLLTASQYGGDTVTTKIRRPHTKHSWKWKWDSIKKFKIISEGGKIIKKMKQPILGLRDLSKLDTWTQLTMRQKYETYYEDKSQSSKASEQMIREDKQRLNEQLSLILDMRVLPHIILEQNEQSITKLENDDIDASDQRAYDEHDGIAEQTFTDENLLSMLNLQPFAKTRVYHSKIILSGEWARPRCYLCICCGTKFEKLKSLEEHKIFRHSHILPTHYEVVGRELLAGNLLQHLFLPKSALNRYENGKPLINSFHKCAWSRIELRSRNCLQITGDDESLDSIQSTFNVSTHSYSIKNSSTEDCDTDIKMPIDVSSTSSTHSMQSSNCSGIILVEKIPLKYKESIYSINCTKCQRKFNGVLDLYRHMLDCSGDYIWSLAKKRKYRYYCGSKKRRHCNKHYFADLTKRKSKIVKTEHTLEHTEVSSKIKLGCRSRPSDAESIQKMLENLPPKRVCKKIFPTLTKTRKSKKTKFASKHKMYNTRLLKKKRTRKMTQSSNSFSSKCKKVVGNNEKSTKRITFIKDTKKMDSLLFKNSQYFPNGNACFNEKFVNEPDKINKTTKTVNHTNQSVENNDSRISSNCIMNDEPLKTVSETSCVNANENESRAIEISTSKNKICIESEEKSHDTANVSEIKNHATNTTSSENDNAKTIECPAIEKTQPICVDNCNFNKKRSKRINDCIAMLTGKLEEKLKTEQYSNNKKESSVSEKNSIDNEKKLPKRKAVSRRIIKLDISNVETLSEQSKIENNSNKSSSSKDIIQNPNSNVSAMPPAIETAENTSIIQNQHATDPKILNVIKKPVTEVFTALPIEREVSSTSVSTVPIISNKTIPIEIANTQPKLARITFEPSSNMILPEFTEVVIKPFQIPRIEEVPLLKRVNNSDMVKIDHVPIPITLIPLPKLTAQNTNISKKIVISPRTMQMPSNIIMPVQSTQTLTNLAPSVLQEQKLNVAKNIFNETEPLNLSNVNYTQKRISEQNLITNKLQQYRIPNRRQTICGFETLNIFGSDGIEPLDLSKKSLRNSHDNNNPIVDIVPMKNKNDSDIIGSKLTVIPVAAIPNNQYYSNLDLLKIPQIRTTTATSSFGNEMNNSSKNNLKRRNNKFGCDNQPKIVNSSVSNKEISNKKDCGKNKFLQKMDEEVINHIDDAINSVINAVKASLSENDEAEDKIVKHNSNRPDDQVVTLDPVTSNPVNQFNFQITEKKEMLCSKTAETKICAVSKTVDCELSDLNYNGSKILETDNNSNISTPLKISCLDENATVHNETNHSNNVKSLVENTENCKSNAKIPEKAAESAGYTETSNKNEELHCTNTTALFTNITSSDKNSILPEPLKTTEILNSEENISSINNTSSGFCSSGQSENGADPKKRQRRRRKNELAAIVADQLLESFKIDNVRRDNLKKLENLAYEKSEDLLLTGMLLMSNTKRNTSNSVLEKVTVNNLQNNKNLNHNRIKCLNNNNKSVQKIIKFDKGNMKFDEQEANASVDKEEKGLNKKGNKKKVKDKDLAVVLRPSLRQTVKHDSNIVNPSLQSHDTNSEYVRSSILKPSILPDPSELSKTTNVKSSELTSKSNVSSRDPRLNKNIHKEDKETDKELIPQEGENQVDVCDLEEDKEDNYLTEIAKNVNEKIMSTENEEFSFVNDGIEIMNQVDYYRPPTSMSVRSAPNLNDDHSNFGSMCDENTNTEVTDMDLDDEMSIYTSYSQDVCRRGRKRRRRRSILLKKRPKKRLRVELDEKFECLLCKKTFFTANSLTKHNMTLAHVSKLSELEYLQSKTNNNSAKENNSVNISAEVTKNASSHNSDKNAPIINNDKNINESNEKQIDDKEKNELESTSHLNLNPDERLFFECCNILKGTEALRINNVSANSNNYSTNTFAFPHNNKTSTHCINNTCSKASGNKLQKHQACKLIMENQFPNKHNPTMLSLKALSNELNAVSSNYTAASQFSNVTNTISRFKTKAAMKGYENAVDLPLACYDSKRKSVCKLTELAEIALSTEKQNSLRFDFTKDIPLEINYTKPINTPQSVIISVANDDDDDDDDKPINNETKSSTSSKTIMHSSIIKAAVQEHNKGLSNKIIIPDRPFKNIGLEEKETITFQKPKITHNFLAEDNSLSTVSYSDRDDFDFGSISCEDENNVKANCSDSSSSRATAKTFENKSLIMGRIFKNVTAKSSGTVKSKVTGVQKDQNPTFNNKAELNQLFDELKDDNKTRMKQTQATVEKEVNVTKDTVEVSKKENETENGCTVNKASAKKTRCTTRKNSKNNSQKEISRLQSELGMSPDEIVKLINEGQRKSKRRCVANHAKKLVEIWSSDEYEEFLCTKDIIALIEEKEKEELKRKRKSYAVNSATSNVENKIISPKTFEYETNRKKDEKSLKKSNKDQNDIEDKKICVQTNKKKNNSKVVNTTQTAAMTNDNNHSKKVKRKHSKRTCSKKANNSDSYKDEFVYNARPIRNNLNNDIVENVKDKEIIFGSIAKETCRPESKCSFKHVNEKQNTNYNNKNIKGKNNLFIRDVNKFKSLGIESGLVKINTRKKGCNNKTYKNKRKIDINKSPPRQKRLATEKLYYWSSSSDEDFGRLSLADNADNSGEQYQKHGWIVGDSHKKLVTLLAITKGNKKVDCCGVKKNISRKKS